MFSSSKAIALLAFLATAGSVGVAYAGEQAPGTCAYAGYLGHNSPTKLIGYAADGTLTAIGQSDKTYNAMGYNRLDGKIYAMSSTGDVVYKIDPATGGVTESVNVKAGAGGRLPVAPYYQGDISPDGKHWYVRAYNAFQVINVDPGSPDYLTYEKAFTAPVPDIYDISFHPTDGKIYIASGSKVVRLDPATGAVSPVGNLPWSGTWGGQFFDAAGNLYLSGNAGWLAKADLTRVEDGLAQLGTVVKVGQGAATANNDGAPCVPAPAPVVVPPDPYVPDPYATPN